MAIVVKSGSFTSFRNFKLYTKQAVADIPWWSYKATMDDMRFDAAIPTSAAYTLGAGETPTGDGPVWFSNFAGGTGGEVVRQDTVVPISALYDAGAISPSSWYDSYTNGVNNEAVRQDVVTPTSASYQGTLPDDTFWWTSYSNGASNESARIDTTVPTSAQSAIG